MNTTHGSATLAMPVSPERDHIRGPASAAVTLLEYGDYECPYCHAAHAVVNTVQAQLQSRLRFVFRHFPLTTVHPHAQTAAEAAESAGTQRKFWQMHDTLFTTQTPLTDNLFVAAAATIGLDMPSFYRELTGHVHVPRLREDFMTGVRSGVNGTPTFYINSVRYDGAWDLPTLLGALDRESGG
ncbi:MAG: oxidoreductase [Gammaproteobacteria bacterium]|nr:oxidoreductase [Gammaproteobacteria bacterium]